MTIPTTTPTTTPTPPPTPIQNDSPLRTLFHSTVGNLLILFSTILFGWLGTLSGFIPPRGRWMLLCCRWWSQSVLWASGVRIKAIFETPLDPSQGYVFLANHQSMYDIPAILVSVPSEVRFLAKRSLFYIPFFGWGLWAGGFIPVDRKNRKAAQKTFLLAERSLRAGNSLVIFPEETRSEDGELLPFKRGGMLLAQRTGFPVVPVGIEGTWLLKPKGSFQVKSGQAIIRYGTPIPPPGKGAESQAAWLEEARQEIGRLAGLRAAESQHESQHESQDEK